MGSEPQKHYPLAVAAWTNYMTPLSLIFLACKVQMAYVLTIYVDIKWDNLWNQFAQGQARREWLINANL